MSEGKALSQGDKLSNGLAVKSYDFPADLKHSCPARFNDKLQTAIDGMLHAKGLEKRNSSQLKCSKCWMLLQPQSNCFCDEIPHEVQVKHRVYVYMHWREAALKKASNTAKVIPLAVPDAHLVTCGAVQQEVAFYRDISSAKHVFILFPTDDAVSFTELLQTDDRVCTPIPSTNAGTTAAASASQENTTTDTTNNAPCLQPVDCPPYTIVVIDGSWNGARFLNKILPQHIPRVKLTGRTNYDLGETPTRHERVKGNMLTMTAFVHLLANMHGRQSAEVMHLGAILRLATQAYRKQAPDLLPPDAY